MPESTAPSVSPAFAATPENPNLVAPAAQPAPNADQNPNPNPAPQPAGGANIDAVLASLKDVNAQYNLSDTNPPEPQPAPEANPQPAPEPPAPQFDWQAMFQQQQAVNQQAQQAAQRNAELEERVRQQDEVINNLMLQQEEYNKLKNQTQADNLEFGDLATVDADDAKRISAAVLQAVQTQLAPLQEALAKTQQMTQQSTQWQEQRFAQQRIQDTLSKVVAKHPDFLKLQSDPAYLQFIRQRDGLSSQTYDARAAYEFQNGNAEYVINLVDQFKQRTPKANSITSVAPVQTANNPVAPAGSVTKLPTLSELNQWMQMRQITPDQYNQILAKIRAAQKQG